MVALGQFRLRTVFVVPFVLQIICAVGLIAYLAFSTGQKAIQDLTLNLRSEISTRVQEKLTSLLEVPHAINQVNAVAAKLGLLRTQETDTLRLYFQQQLMGQSALTLVGLGTEQPVYVDVARLDAVDALKLAVWNPARGPVKNWKIGLDGSILESIPTDPTYDHRQRPWYKSAVAAGKAGWSSIYLTKTPQRLVVSATQPVYNDAHGLFGVAVSSLSLTGISDFLKTLKIGKTGQSFILERSGDLVASSTSEMPFIVEGDQPKRLNVRNSTNLLTRETAQNLMQRFADLGALTTPTHFDFAIHGERQLVQVVPFSDGRGLAWTIVVVVPESDFMQEITKSTHTAGLITLAALLVAIAVGFFTTRWVTGPITAIHEAAGEIAAGHWNKVVQVDRDDELGDLARIFNRMAAQVRETLTTLEQRVAERTTELAQANGSLEARVEARTQELAKAMDHLVQTEKMATLGGMVAGITHELNTPLSNVRLAAAGLAAQVQELSQAMLEGRITRSAMDGFIAYSKETTALIDRASERSSALIAGFKQVAVDQSSDRRRRFQLLEIAQHTVQSLGPTLKATPFKVVLDIPAGLELDSFPGPIEQIVTNLITNSLAHAFADRSHGSMLFQARSQGSDLELVYGDDGAGFDSDVELRIFDPFFTTKVGQGGSGLGMYTIYNLVTGLFGGRILVEGRPGTGARFTMLLKDVVVMDAKAGPAQAA
jgi:C4-dicarboxylate-specific signal transduction histidine kinase